MAMEFSRLLLFVLVKLYRWTLLPIFNIIFNVLNSAPPVSVPPVTNPLLLKSATELSKMIRNKEVNCTEVLEAFIERSKLVNATINSICSNCYEVARQQALEVNQILEQDDIPDEYSEENAPFLGVPLSVKEAFALTGMPNTSGLVVRKNTIATKDAEVIANLRKSGVIPYVVTNISELCMWYESANNIYGRSCNPYDNRCIAGGSSGGEGCLIGSGASIIGVGSDIGGSIRIPSFFNGIFGHKPSSGIVSNDGQFPNASGQQKELLCVGPMCRYAEDLKPMLRIMAGENAKKLKLDEPVDLKKLKIYYMDHDEGGLFSSSVQPEMKKAIHKVANHFKKKYGIDAEPVRMSQMKYSFEIWCAKLSAKSEDHDPLSTFCYFMTDGQYSINPVIEFLKWVVYQSDHTIPAIALALSEYLLDKLDTTATDEMFLSFGDTLKKKMVNLLEENCVFLFPPHPRVAPYHNQPLTTPFDFSYTAIFNYLGFPVTQCPVGLSSEGLPLGVQVVGSDLADHVTIAVAQEIQAAFGGWVNPCA
ncbi:fatty-acid amide hydrolase 2 isoform X1 [Octopus bimaculoides]|uniref:Amidase domain-containing protein n=2 Tax=Octopus bimaculoides TaxID=37653 RepID=A0A0L8H5K7_OCTBM|nr:fatty-acid amide hydrolase 2 isoform X1 [Octopus bimaculoides]|eukprot:XP_014775321.1 PREDICTED: fatty-acid amide hydrolase 2-like isoform X1 [Octopus bimaculoides]